MQQDWRGFLRNNAFLVAAALLPAVVVGLFLLSSAIPARLVAPPTHDLLLSTSGPFDQAQPRVAVEFTVRDGRVTATLRALPANVYPQRETLFLFEHATMSVREVPIPLPTDMVEGDAPRTFAVEELASRRVIAPVTSPDGYHLESRSHRGPGIIGEIFGMNRYNPGLTLVNGSRVIPIQLPTPGRYPYPGFAVGWLNEAAR